MIGAHPPPGTWERHPHGAVAGRRGPRNAGPGPGARIAGRRRHCRRGAVLEVCRTAAVPRALRSVAYPGPRRTRHDPSA